MGLRKKKRLDKKAMRILTNYRWPGNVRELKNVAERLVIMNPGQVITAKDLPPSVTGKTSVANGEAAPYHAPSIKEGRMAFEKEYIAQKLKQFGNNISKTAEAIGLERSTLHRKIKSFGIEIEK